jgi:hypothetical protein
MEKGWVEGGGSTGTYRINPGRRRGIARAAARPGVAVMASVTGPP